MEALPFAMPSANRARPPLLLRATSGSDSLAGVVREDEY